MRIFTHEDCDQTGASILLYQKVVVYSKDKLAESIPNQLFLCIDRDSTEMNTHRISINLISLSDGERYLGRREEIVGTLKPELLPDDAKLQLSQMAKRESRDFEKSEPLYSGYCFLPDGRYTSGVWLCSPREVVDFIELQKRYQHRVLICDRDDFAVMEIIDGQLVYPDAQTFEEFQKEQEPDGGMIMT